MTFKIEGHWDHWHLLNQKGELVSEHATWVEAVEERAALNSVVERLNLTESR